MTVRFDLTITVDLPVLVSSLWLTLVSTLKLELPELMSTITANLPELMSSSVVDIAVNSKSRTTKLMSTLTIAYLYWCHLWGFHVRFGVHCS